MENRVRKYGLLACLLFLVCLFPKIGGNSVYANVTDTIQINNVINTQITDTATKNAIDTASRVVYKPSPQKAFWYSALCPGLGQLYNRRYWKLPLVGAGVVGIAYAIGWNQKYYHAYTNAYRDITDENPNTNSYLDLLPNTSKNYSESQLATVLSNRQQAFRRSRDLSIIGALGVYLFCLIDAYVDAQLYDFDVSPDLTLSPKSPQQNGGIMGGIELNLAFRF